MTKYLNEENEKLLKYLLCQIKELFFLHQGEDYIYVLAMINVLSEIIVVNPEHKEAKEELLKAFEECYKHYLKEYEKE